MIDPRTTRDALKFNSIDWYWSHHVTCFNRDSTLSRQEYRKLAFILVFLGTKHFIEENRMEYVATVDQWRCVRVESGSEAMRHNSAHTRGSERKEEKTIMNIRDTTERS